MAKTLLEPTAKQAAPRGAAPRESVAGKAIVERLNRRLADAIDLQLQAKQAHWNVQGPNFIALHDLFERVAVNVAHHADLLAERAVQLGGFVEGTVRAVAEHSELAPYPPRITSEADHVAAITRALKSFGAKLRPGIAEAEEAEDHATADILTEVARDIDKLRWLVETHAR